MYTYKILALVAGKRKTVNHYTADKFEARNLFQKFLNDYGLQNEICQFVRVR